jgi:hypothetical protein
MLTKLKKIIFNKITFSNLNVDLHFNFNKFLKFFLERISKKLIYYSTKALKLVNFEQYLRT